MNFTKKHIFDIEGVQTMDGSQIITYLHGWFLNDIYAKTVTNKRAENVREKN